MGTWQSITNGSATSFGYGTCRIHLSLLDSSEFKTKVVTIVNADQDVLSLAPSVSMLGALASALSGPAAPIVLPIVAALVIGHWTVLLVKQAGNN